MTSYFVRRSGDLRVVGGFVAIVAAIVLPLATCSELGFFSGTGLFIVPLCILLLCSFQPLVVLFDAVSVHDKDLTVMLAGFILASFSLMCAVTDFLGLAVFMQIAAVFSYVLVMASNRAQYSWQWSEALSKYVIYSSFAGVFTVSGIAAIYWVFGTGNYSEIYHHIYMNLAFNRVVATVGFFFVLAGFFAKSGFAPFHAWLVEAYSGLPIVIISFFSVVVKLGYLIVLQRLVHLVPSHSVFEFVALIVVASLYAGTVGTASQPTFKRFMVYSGVGHSGWVGVSLLGTYSDYKATAFLYLLFYGLFVGAVFRFVIKQNTSCGQLPIFLTDFEHPISNLSKFDAVHFAVLIFSVAGIPPLFGFFVKFAYLSALFTYGSVWLVVVLLIASLFAAYNYLRFMRVFMPFGNLLKTRTVEYSFLAWISALNLYWIFFHKFVYEYIYSFTIDTAW